MPASPRDVPRISSSKGRPEQQGRPGTLVSAAFRAGAPARAEADLLLWGTGYGVDLSSFEAPEIASNRTLKALAVRCGCIFRRRDAASLCFPGKGLDRIGAPARRRSASLPR